MASVSVDILNSSDHVSLSIMKYPLLFLYNELFVSYNFLC